MGWSLGEGATEPARRVCWHAWMAGGMGGGIATGTEVDPVV